MIDRYPYPTGYGYLLFYLAACRSAENGYLYLPNFRYIVA